MQKDLQKHLLLSKVKKSLKETLEKINIRFRLARNYVLPMAIFQMQVASRKDFGLKPEISYNERKKSLLLQSTKIDNGIQIKSKLVSIAFIK